MYTYYSFRLFLEILTTALIWYWYSSLKRSKSDVLNYNFENETLLIVEKLFVMKIMMEEAVQTPSPKNDFLHRTWK